MYFSIVSVSVLVSIWVSGVDTLRYPSTGPEHMKTVREEYLRLRDQAKQDTTAAVTSS